MFNQYFSVEETAKIIGMHPKTVARYIREGKLPANKVGKEWRISGHDLSVFVEGQDAGARAYDKTARPVSVTSVVDIPGVDRENAMRIANTLTAAVNGRPREAQQASVSTQYIESDGLLRVMLWGSPKFIEVLMGTIGALVQNEGGAEERGIKL